ncbi:hypothetical protein [Propionicicella superfundia]|uniref:hypothetical protein n=1 Tax=Propionicicella superfundia TaxID=348582 RepID=UPI00048FBCDA|nr:hypothetical protein [Propionicicella superfundia]
MKYVHESTPSQHWTDESYRLQQEGRIRTAAARRRTGWRITAAGPCPRCSGPFTFREEAEQSVVARLDDEVADAEGVASAAALGDGDGPPSTVTVTCDAPGIYDGAPGGVAGCGACFTLYVL